MTTFDVHITSITDIAALEEVYVWREYDWDLPKTPKVILDLGAHYGDTCLYYHARYPEAKIIAVEASPGVYERLVQHTKDISNVTPVHAAVSEKTGHIELFEQKDNDLGHSLYKRQAANEAVTVPSRTLADLQKEFNQGQPFDLIKFDIEGAEESLFRTVGPAQAASAYIGEMHYDLISLAPDEVSNFFSGFKVTQINLKNNRAIIRALKIEQNVV